MNLSILNNLKSYYMNFKAHNKLIRSIENDINDIRMLIWIWRIREESILYLINN